MKILYIKQDKTLLFYYLLKAFNLNLLQPFIEFIKDRQLFTTSEGLLIAVSGGVDSTVLCHLCHQAGYSFSIAHCNFGLRGEESIRDEVFVTSLAQQFKVPFYSIRFDTKEFAEVNKLSIQEAARKLRYDWFGDILKGKVKPVSGSSGNSNSYLKFLLTAHHLDDNIETVLMNFFKGTGISGLRGIQPKSGSIIRPLLFAKRSEVQAYAIENSLRWVNDSSNDESKYTRNYFRHEIIPAIEKAFPEAINNVAQNIQRFSETEVLYRQAVDLHKKNLLQLKGDEVHIPVLKLLKSDPLATIVYEIIKDFGFGNKQVKEVISLLGSESGKYITSQTHRILRNRKWLIISPLKANYSPLIVIEEGEKEVYFEVGALEIQTLDKNISYSSDRNIAVLDARDIKYPLLLRKWKPGDYFYPLGMPKKKKLSRFFIDQKLSKGDKEHIWVLESNKKILWVVGLRIDDRFKVDSTTRSAIRVVLNSL